jgi:hypothetical protein
MPPCRPEVQYPTHIPLNTLQKGAVGLLSLLGAFNDPRRGDLVAAAGETTGLLPLQVGLLLLVQKSLQPLAFRWMRGAADALPILRYEHAALPGPIAKP